MNFNFTNTLVDGQIQTKLMAVPSILGPNNKTLCWDYLLCFGVIYGRAASVLLSVRVWYTHRDREFMVHSGAPYKIWILNHFVWQSAWATIKTSWCIQVHPVLERPPRLLKCQGLILATWLWLVAGDWSAKTWDLHVTCDKTMTGSHLCCQVNLRKKNKLCFAGAVSFNLSSCEHCLHFLCACDCGSTGQIKSTLKNQTFFLKLYTNCFECTLSCHFSTVNTKHIQTLLRDSAKSPVLSASTCSAEMVSFTSTLEMAMEWQTLYTDTSKGKTERKLIFLLAYFK